MLLGEVSGHSPVEFVGRLGNWISVNEICVIKTR